MAEVNGTFNIVDMAGKADVGKTALAFSTAAEIKEKGGIAPSPELFGHDQGIAAAFLTAGKTVAHNNYRAGFRTGV
jgi:hypothetical protein